MASFARKLGKQVAVEAAIKSVMAALKNAIDDVVQASVKSATKEVQQLAISRSKKIIKDVSTKYIKQAQELGIRLLQQDVRKAFFDTLTKDLANITEQASKDIQQTIAKSANKAVLESGQQTVKKTFIDLGTSQTDNIIAKNLASQQSLTDVAKTKAAQMGANLTGDAFAAAAKNQVDSVQRAVNSFRDTIQNKISGLAKQNVVSKETLNTLQESATRSYDNFRSIAKQEQLLAEQLRLERLRETLSMFDELLTIGLSTNRRASSLQSTLLANSSDALRRSSDAAARGTALTSLYKNQASQIADLNKSISSQYSDALSKADALKQVNTGNLDVQKIVEQELDSFGKNVSPRISKSTSEVAARNQLINTIESQKQTLSNKIDTLVNSSNQQFKTIQTEIDNARQITSGKRARLAADGDTYAKQADAQLGSLRSQQDQARLTISNSLKEADLVQKKLIDDINIAFKSTDDQISTSARGFFSKQESQLAELKKVNDNATASLTKSMDEASKVDSLLKQNTEVQEALLKAQEDAVQNLAINKSAKNRAKKARIDTALGNQTSALSRMTGLIKKGIDEIQSAGNKLLDSFRSSATKEKDLIDSKVVKQLTDTDQLMAVNKALSDQLKQTQLNSFSSLKSKSDTAIGNSVDSAAKGNTLTSAYAKEADEIKALANASQAELKTAISRADQLKSANRVLQDQLNMLTSNLDALNKEIKSKLLVTTQKNIASSGLIDTLLLEKDALSKQLDTLITSSRSQFDQFDSQIKKLQSDIASRKSLLGSGGDAYTKQLQDQLTILQTNRKSFLDSMSNSLTLAVRSETEMIANVNKVIKQSGDTISSSADTLLRRQQTQNSALKTLDDTASSTFSISQKRATDVAQQAETDLLTNQQLFRRQQDAIQNMASSRSSKLNARSASIQRNLSDQTSALNRMTTSIRGGIKGAEATTQNMLDLFLSLSKQQDDVFQRLLQSQTKTADDLFTLSAKQADGWKTLNADVASKLTDSAGDALRYGDTSLKNADALRATYAKQADEISSLRAKSVEELNTIAKQSDELMSQNRILQSNLAKLTDDFAAFNKEATSRISKSNIDELASTKLIDETIEVQQKLSGRLDTFIADSTAQFKQMDSQIKELQSSIASRKTLVGKAGDEYTQALQDQLNILISRRQSFQDSMSNLLAGAVKSEQKMLDNLNVVFRSADTKIRDSATDFFLRQQDQLSALRSVDSNASDLYSIGRKQGDDFLQSSEQALRVQQDSLRAQQEAIRQFVSKRANTIDQRKLRIGQALATQNSVISRMSNLIQKGTKQLQEAASNVLDLFKSLAKQDSEVLDRLIQAQSKTADDLFAIGSKQSDELRAATDSLSSSLRNASDVGLSTSETALRQGTELQKLYAKRADDIAFLKQSSTDELGRLSQRSSDLVANNKLLQNNLSQLTDEFGEFSRGASNKLRKTSIDDLTNSNLIEQAIKKQNDLSKQLDNLITESVSQFKQIENQIDELQTAIRSRGDSLLKGGDEYTKQLQDQLDVLLRQRTTFEQSMKNFLDEAFQAEQKMLDDMNVVFRQTDARIQNSIQDFASREAAQAKSWGDLNTKSSSDYLNSSAEGDLFARRIDDDLLFNQQVFKKQQDAIQELGQSRMAKLQKQSTIIRDQLTTQNNALQKMSGLIKKGAQGLEEISQSTLDLFKRLSVQEDELLERMVRSQTSTADDLFALSAKNADGWSTLSRDLSKSLGETSETALRYSGDSLRKADSLGGLYARQADEIGTFNRSARDEFGRVSSQAEDLASKNKALQSELTSLIDDMGSFDQAVKNRIGKSNLDEVANSNLIDSAIKSQQDLSSRLDDLIQVSKNQFDELDKQIENLQTTIRNQSTGLLRGGDEYAQLLQRQLDDLVLRRQNLQSAISDLLSRAVKSEQKMLAELNNVFAKLENQITSSIDTFSKQQDELVTGWRSLDSQTTNALDNASKQANDLIKKIDDDVAGGQSMYKQLQDSLQASNAQRVQKLRRQAEVVRQQLINQTDALKQLTGGVRSGIKGIEEVTQQTLDLFITLSKQEDDVFQRLLQTQSKGADDLFALSAKNADGWSSLSRDLSKSLGETSGNMLRYGDDALKRSDTLGSMYAKQADEIGAFNKSAKDEFGRISKQADDLASSNKALRDELSSLLDDMDSFDQAVRNRLSKANVDELANSNLIEQAIKGQQDFSKQLDDLIIASKSQFDQLDKQIADLESTLRSMSDGLVKGGDEYAQQLQRQLDDLLLQRQTFRDSMGDLLSNAVLAEKRMIGDINTVFKRFNDEISSTISTFSRQQDEVVSGWKSLDSQASDALSQSSRQADDLIKKVDSDLGYQQSLFKQQQDLIQSSSTSRINKLRRQNALIQQYLMDQTAALNKLTAGVKKGVRGLEEVSQQTLDLFQALAKQEDEVFQRLLQTQTKGANDLFALSAKNADGWSTLSRDLSASLGKKSENVLQYGDDALKRGNSLGSRYAKQADEINNLGRSARDELDVVTRRANDLASSNRKLESSLSELVDDMKSFDQAVREKVTKTNFDNLVDSNVLEKAIDAQKAISTKLDDLIVASKSQFDQLDKQIADLESALKNQGDLLLKGGDEYAQQLQRRLDDLLAQRQTFKNSMSDLLSAAVQTEKKMIDDLNAAFKQIDNQINSSVDFFTKQQDELASRLKALDNEASSALEQSSKQADGLGRKMDEDLLSQQSILRRQQEAAQAFTTNRINRLKKQSEIIRKELTDQTDALNKLTAGVQSGLRGAENISQQTLDLFRTLSKQEDDVLQRLVQAQSKGADDLFSLSGKSADGWSTMNRGLESSLKSTSEDVLRYGDDALKRSDTLTSLYTKQADEIGSLGRSARDELDVVTKRANDLKSGNRALQSQLSGLVDELKSFDQTVKNRLSKSNLDELANSNLIEQSIKRQEDLSKQLDDLILASKSQFEQLNKQIADIESALRKQGDTLLKGGDEYARQLQRRLDDLVVQRQAFKDSMGSLLADAVQAERKMLDDLNGVFRQLDNNINSSIDSFLRNQEEVVSKWKSLGDESAALFDDVSKQGDDLIKKVDEDVLTNQTSFQKLQDAIQSKHTQRIQRLKRQSELIRMNLSSQSDALNKLTTGVKKGFQQTEEISKNTLDLFRGLAKQEDEVLQRLVQAETKAADDLFALGGKSGDGWKSLNRDVAGKLGSKSDTVFKYGEDAFKKADDLASTYSRQADEIGSFTKSSRDEFSRVTKQADELASRNKFLQDEIGTLTNKLDDFSKDATSRLSKASVDDLANANIIEQTMKRQQDLSNQLDELIQVSKAQFDQLDNQINDLETLIRNKGDTFMKSGDSYAKQLQSELDVLQTRRVSLRESISSGLDVAFKSEKKMLDDLNSAFKQVTNKLDSTASDFLRQQDEIVKRWKSLGDDTNTTFSKNASEGNDLAKQFDDDMVTKQQLLKKQQDSIQEFTNKRLAKLREQSLNAQNALRRQTDALNQMSTTITKGVKGAEEVSQHTLDLFRGLSKQNDELLQRMVQAQTKAADDFFSLSGKSADGWKKVDIDNAKRLGDRSGDALRFGDDAIKRSDSLRTTYAKQADDISSLNRSSRDQLDVLTKRADDLLSQNKVLQDELEALTRQLNTFDEDAATRLAKAGTDGASRDALYSALKAEKEQMTKRLDDLIATSKKQFDDLNAEIRNVESQLQKQSGLLKKEGDLYSVQLRRRLDALEAQKNAFKKNISKSLDDAIQAEAKMIDDANGLFKKMETDLNFKKGKFARKQQDELSKLKRADNESKSGFKKSQKQADDRVLKESQEKASRELAEKSELDAIDNLKKKKGSKLDEIDADIKTKKKLKESIMDRVKTLMKIGIAGIVVGAIGGSMMEDEEKQTTEEQSPAEEEQPPPEPSTEGEQPTEEKPPVEEEQPPAEQVEEPTVDISKIAKVEPPSTEEKPLIETPLIRGLIIIGFIGLLYLFFRRKNVTPPVVSAPIISPPILSPPILSPSIVPPVSAFLRRKW